MYGNALITGNTLICTNLDKLLERTGSSSTFNYNLEYKFE